MFYIFFHYFLNFYFCAEVNEEEILQKEIMNKLILNDKNLFADDSNYMHDALSEIDACKKIYPKQIFGFQNILYQKIWDCQKGDSIVFNKDEIKILLSFSIPTYDTNGNITRSILKSLLSGLFHEIFSDYMITIGNSVSKIAIKHIINLLNESIENDFFEEVDLYLSNNEFAKVKEFNKIVQKDVFEEIISFFENIYSLIKIKKIKLDIDFEINISEMMQKIKDTHLKECLKSIKKFNQLIFDDKLEFIKEMKPITIDKIFEFLSKEILTEKERKILAKEHHKIFFSIDFLCNYFFSFCSDNITIEICDRNGNSLSFFSNSNKMNLKPIICDLSDFSELYFPNLYLEKFLTLKDSINNIPSKILNLIGQLENLKIDIKYYLIREFYSSENIDCKIIKNFSDFLEYFQKNKHIIILDEFKSIYDGSNYKPINTLNLKKTMNLCLVRFLLRKSFQNLVFSDEFREENIQLYHKIYNIFTPIVEPYKEMFVLLSTSINKKNTLQVRIESKIQSILIKKHLLSAENTLYLECNKEIINNDFDRSGLYYDQILIFGDVESLILSNYKHIHGIIFGEFYFILIDQARPGYFEKLDLRHHFSSLNFNLPSGYIFISTSYILDIYFYDTFRFMSRYECDSDRSANLSYDDGNLSGLNLIVEISYIPFNIKCLIFTHSVIKCKSDFLMDLDKLNMMCLIYLNFCCVENIMRIICKIDKLDIINSSIRSKFIVENHYEIDDLFIFNSSGSFEINGLRITEKLSIFRPVVKMTQYKSFRARDCVLEGELFINNPLENMHISNCELSINIRIESEEIVISNCLGNFSIFLKSFNYDFGNIQMKGNSTFEVTKKKKKYCFKFMNLIFDKNHKNFFDSNRLFKYTIRNCDFQPHIEA